MSRFLLLILPAAAAILGCVSVVRLADIQATEPVRTMTFTGSHKTVAECIYVKLQGRAEGADAPFGGTPVIKDKLVIYDSVRSFSRQGLSHYAMTIMKTGPDSGALEWRVVGTLTGKEKTSAQPKPIPLSDAAVNHFWIPAQECAAKGG